MGDIFTDANNDRCDRCGKKYNVNFPHSCAVPKELVHGFVTAVLAQVTPDPAKTNFKDKARRPIFVGDLIIYGHALGRCAGLQYGKVMGMAKSRLAVQGVDSDWNSRAPKLNQRKGGLAYGDRILVVTRDQVPPAVLKLLDEVQA